MANQVTFQIKIETVGGENVKNVTMDAEELGRVVKEVTDEQEKLNTKLLDINQAQQAIENVTSGISQIASEISKYASAYSVQETAGRKVAQVMQNTMNATEAEIESIYKLCEAQQELGVIGDEVQMAGAQELATYLEKKSSLEKLIPVMNDMLAQQYGLEASQESAATIATMLGKVMEGQTQALSRYGYSFDETQEKVLKFGTEEERAAVLAEVVSQSVGGMNAALAQTDAGNSKKVADSIDDIKEVVGACMVRLQPFVSTIDEIGMGVQGIMSVYQGVRGLTVGITSLTIVQRGWNTVTVTSTAIIRTLTTVMRGGTVAATTLRVAIRGLLIATGVGAAITVLTMAIEAFTSSSDKAADSAEDFANAQSDETAQLQQTRAALEINIAKLKDFHGSKEQEKKIVEEMNNTYGETMGYFSSVAEWYNALIKNSDAYCRQMVIEARTRMLANQIAEKEQKIHDLKYDETGKARQYSKQREKKTVAHVEDTGLYGEGNVTYERIEVEGTSDLEKATAAYHAERLAVEELQKQLRGLVREASTIKMPVIGAASRSAGSTGSKGGVGRERMDVGKIGGLDLSGFSADIDLTPHIDGAAALKDMNNLGWEVEMKVDAAALEEIEKKAAAARKKFDFATDSVENFGGALSGLGGALELPELNFAGVLAQGIATMVQGYATATAQAGTMGPWAWLAFGALGLAQLTAMISSVKSVAKLADGAVAYGPTLGLFGEYANAATNPEVVAPLDKLRGILGVEGGGGQVDIKLRMRGRDLVGVSSKRTKLVRRS